MAKEITLKELKAMAAKLNGLKLGKENLLEAIEADKVKTNRVKFADLAAAFMDAMEACADDKKASAKVPKLLEQFHNRLFDQVEGEPEDDDEEPPEDEENGDEDDEDEGDEDEEDEDDEEPPTRRTRKKKPATAKKKKAPKVSMSREEAVGKAFAKGGTEDKIAEAADTIYEKAGGASNVKQSKKLVQRAVKYYRAINILEESSKGRLTLNI